MTRVLPLLLLVVAACTRPAPGWVSRGALVLAPEALGAGASQAQISAVVTTEAEEVKGGLAARRIVERFGLDRSPDFDGGDPAEAVRQALACSRRGETLVLDVSATAARPELARQLCNAALEAAVMRRRELKEEARRLRAARLGERLDALPPDAGEAAALVAELQQVSMPSYESDERVLEPCGAPVKVR